MLHINELTQALYCFSPLKTVLISPGERMIQVRNGLPETEAPLEQTVYITVPSELAELSHLPSSSSVILYVVITSPEMKRTDIELPYWVENYLLLPPDTSRSALYHLLRKLIPGSDHGNSGRASGQPVVFV